ncbi:MAG: ABC transporter ATP-binding protein [Erysipelotrichaceae bacterium]
MENIIELAGITKNYASIKALNAVDLSLPKGKIIGLLGPNGSGKSTMIKILTGIIKDFKGDVKVDGKKIGIYTKSIVSYLPDSPFFPEWMKVKEAISLFKDMYFDFDDVKALEILGKFSIDPNMVIKSMSKGTKEKFQLILTMSRKAKVIILDEPIGGVDPAAREVILKIILENFNDDQTVIIATHLIADIEQIFDQVVFIKDGIVVLNKDVEELRTETNKSVDELFREEFRCY